MIEDFVSNVQVIGTTDSYRHLKVYYDTGVLLRLLGTSGHLFQTATLEMHAALQMLGCDTYYLDPNATEVQNILDTLEGAYSRGKEIFGETSDAIHTGEITIGTIKDLAGTFEARLAQLNIFPYPYDFAARRTEDAFQIDEPQFAAALTSAALKNDRGYSAQNAANDAHVVALIIRLRRGKAMRAISQSRHIFVSRNSLLQRVSRQFVDQHVEEYDAASVPPVITVGQVTTLAWLASNKAIEPHKVSRELLANCYNAVQPTETWAEEFAKVLNQFRDENPEFLAERANAMLFLKSARAAARDESLNQPVMLRKLNVAELFRRAAEEQSAANQEYEMKQEELRRELEEANLAALAEVQRKAAEDLEERTRLVEQESRAHEREQLLSYQNERLVSLANSIAGFLIIVLKTTLTLAFFPILLTDSLNILEKGTWPRTALLGVLGGLSILSFLDMIDVKLASVAIQWLRKKLAAKLLYGLRKILGSS